MVASNLHSSEVLSQLYPPKTLSTARQQIRRSCRLKLLRCLVRSFALPSLIIASLAFTHGTVRAETHFVAAKRNGSRTELTIAPGAQTDKVVFYVPVRGNVSTPFAFGFLVPEGAKVKAYGVALRRGTASASSLQAARRSWYPLKEIVFTSQASRGRALRESTSPCSPFNEQQIAAVRSYLSQFYPIEQLNDSVVCALMAEASGSASVPVESPLPQQPTPTPLQPQAPNDAASSVSKLVNGYALLHQDACAKLKGGYAVLMEISLSGVAPSLRDAGFSIAAEMKVVPYRGSKGAVIKPVSDGKFFPQPLLLMTTTGASYQESITLSQWNGTRLRKVQDIKVEDYVFARNRVLSRSVVTKYLRGGKGVFEIFGPYGGYGVCFDLDRRRQERNGY